MEGKGDWETFWTILHNKDGGEDPSIWNLPAQSTGLLKN